ncbi:hypothetical protein LDJ79_09515 [Vibrio tritonius]|uniref:Uncharacterized protein n=1 Tax=Vibrio tritonius TaxID=1435069 RepID=A0ABS7YMR8_9VIBR|nr:hypothetical protein [Vibrio tritonius]MCA2016347.1 hypothetical protein [Vibrio tritonius]
MILSGEEVFYLDGDEIAIKEGDVLKVAHQAARCFKASDVICIQTKTGSLEGFTENDGCPVEVKTSWI